MEKPDYNYLYNINSPAELKKLKPDELVQYCEELRRFIIERLAENPGHLGSSLGTIELTAALHYVFNTPHDKIIWDVGHQAYAHKIITGRRDVFHTNRKLGGISGFTKMSESPYDAFGGGHTSVAISAALGIATASRLRDIGRDVVAIIGDGALTGGLAFEGLNNAGAMNTDLLVILNDNNISIDPNVGAIKEYLLSITTSRRYNKVKNKTWDMLAPVPGLRRMIQKTGDALKQGLLQQSNLFESLNFRYFGPVDGHDIKQLVKVLTSLKNIKGPKLLHVLTVKGKGYEPAENSQSIWHAPGKFDPETGTRLPDDGVKLPPRYQDVFGETICELAETYTDIVGITPAMPSGCSLSTMMDKMPERCFDVGIAEGHAVTFSAGLAAAGARPFCNIYSSFMQRAYDNVIHDVALQNLPVVFCIDRAGIVGEDGPTHHGAFDIAYFRAIPNIVVASPMDESQLRDMMFTAYKAARPFVIRYPRGRGIGIEWKRPFTAIDIGKGRIISEGSDVALLTFGPLGNAAARAVELVSAEGISVLHADMRFAKPLDRDLLESIAARFSDVITVEDGTVSGGFSSAVCEYFSRNRYSTAVHSVALPDSFIEHGMPSELYSICGMDAEGIFEKIKTVYKNKKR